MGFSPQSSESQIDLSRLIIGKAMKVHRALGCGFVEAIYQRALIIELNDAQIAYELQPVLPVFYREIEIGSFQADLIVENRLIIELKAVEGLTVAHSVQLINYLCAARIENGLLLNFGTKSLQFKTKTRTSPHDESSTNSVDLQT